MSYAHESTLLFYGPVSLWNLKVGPLVTKELSNSVIVGIGGTEHPRHYFLRHAPQHLCSHRLAILVTVETIDGLQKLPGLSALRDPDFDRCVETIVQKTWWHKLIRWSGYRAIRQTGMNWSLYYPPFTLHRESFIHFPQKDTFVCFKSLEHYSAYCVH